MQKLDFHKNIGLFYFNKVRGPCAGLPILQPYLTCASLDEMKTIEANGLVGKTEKDGKLFMGNFEIRHKAAQAVRRLKPPTLLFKQLTIN